MDSAFDLSASSRHMPSEGYDALGTILIHRNIFETGRSSDVRMLPEMSADVLEVAEHTTRAPTNTRASEHEHSFSIFIFFLDTTLINLLPRHEKARTSLTGIQNGAIGQTLKRANVAAEF